MIMMNDDNDDDDDDDDDDTVLFYMHVSHAYLTPFMNAVQLHSVYVHTMSQITRFKKCIGSIYDIVSLSSEGCFKN